MKFDEQLWASRQYGFLVEFVHQFAHFRKLSSAYQRLGVKSEFCTRTIGAYLLRSVAIWCMVFGTDSNEIHWKKILLEEDERQRFRDRLRDKLDLDLSSWAAYRDSMLKFRNNYMAHVKAGGDHPAVPSDLDVARHVVEQYDDHVLELLDCVIPEPELRVRYIRLVQIDDTGFEEIVRLGPSLDLPGPTLLG